MAVRSVCESLRVRLLNSLTGEELSGECKFWMGRDDSVACTPERVVRAMWEFNTGGLTRIINPHILHGGWVKVVAFLLPNTVVPLGRFTDLSEHIVRDEDRCMWLTLEVIVTRQR